MQLFLILTFSKLTLSDLKWTEISRVLDANGDTVIREQLIGKKSKVTKKEKKGKFIMPLNEGWLKRHKKAGKISYDPKVNGFKSSRVVKAEENDGNEVVLKGRVRVIRGQLPVKKKMNAPTVIKSSTKKLKTHPRINSSPTNESPRIKIPNPQPSEFPPSSLHYPPSQDPPSSFLSSIFIPELLGLYKLTVSVRLNLTQIRWNVNELRIHIQQSLKREAVHQLNLHRQYIKQSLEEDNSMKFKEPSLIQIPDLIEI
jgi:hypothetical protein